MAKQSRDMIKSPHLNRIVIIVILVIAIAGLLYLLSSNYLFDRDLQTNIELIQTEPITQEPSFNEDDDRVYHIIYDKNDEYSVYAKENIERIIKVLKVKYTVSEINAEVKNITNNDILLLTARKWINYTAEIDNILENVAEGAGLLISLFPGHDSYFVTLQQKFGLYSLGEQRIVSNINIENDILVGLKKGETIETDVAVDLIYEIFTTSDTKVYITDEKEIPMYYTIEYGRGKIGVYNGENILDRAFEGAVVGMLGTLGKEFLYPIIDSGVLFMDDWPAPFIFKDENIYEQYGMDYNDFLEYIWWPDIVSMLEKYDIELSSALLIDYNDLVEPPFDSEYEVLSSEMYVHYKQMMSRAGEIGFHGYNHMPLWFEEYYDEELNEKYTAWPNEDCAIQAMKYAVETFENVFPNYNLNFYVPPSNVIDEKGIDIVKKTMGIPVVICGLYYGTPPQTPSFDYAVKDDVVYFPRLSSGYDFDDEIKFLTAMGATMYGVVSHFIHPDDPVTVEAWADSDWEGILRNFDSYLSFVDKRLPFLDHTTATKAANKTIGWYNMEYDIVYMNDYIKISCVNCKDEYSMLLRSEKKVAEGEGYEFEKIGDETYFLKMSAEQVTVWFEGGN